MSAAQHIFYVRGIDALGNVSADKTRSWTVDLADHKPDAWISAGASYVGNGIYNATGLNQTKTLKKAVGVTATFTLRFENDGTGTDTYTIVGPGSVKGYTVSYSDRTTAYTTKVMAGTLKFTLNPGEYKTLTLRVKIGSTGKSSTGLLVKATSDREPSKVDAVKAVVKRA